MMIMEISLGTRVINQDLITSFHIEGFKNSGVSFNPTLSGFETGSTSTRQIHSHLTNVLKSPFRQYAR